MDDLTVTHDHAQFALAALRGLLRDPPERPDGRLPDADDLAVRLNVTARALRRALAVLEAEALVWRGREGELFGIHSVRRAGALGRIHALLEARLRLEPEIAALAALRATPGDLRLLRRLASREMASSDMEDAELWSGALHRAVASTARNPALLAAFEAMDTERASPEWRALAARTEWSRFEGPPPGVADHGALIEAIAAGDPEDAANAMRANLLELTERLERELAVMRRERDAPGDSDDGSGGSRGNGGDPGSTRPNDGDGDDDGQERDGRDG